jgi:hypothetical protein
VSSGPVIALPSFRLTPRTRAPGECAPGALVREVQLLVFPVSAFSRSPGFPRLELGLPAAADLDLPRLGALRLRQGQAEDAVGEPRRDLVRIDLVGEPERAGELARAELAEVPALVAPARALPPGGDRQHAAIDIDPDVLLA